ncbi:hypothetical protein H310_06683 [Aphanomyces invadans]|uniref:Secreted protein n=1 Tax=Aphanomyces invadans TaxID=157072 RepID=A0A024U479_9STRA|nr:hypothetical protein H310_06683 [Aphanomyces invadans]ETW01054.1 hypothetical protein H310_06683 [Aphanomyces invadans]|eukprot:XP_008870052.1 hypothetical protein H310_06683 [Aphanomyces invadans]
MIRKPLVQVLVFLCIALRPIRQQAPPCERPESMRCSCRGVHFLDPLFLNSNGPLALAHCGGSSRCFDDFGALNQHTRCTNRFRRIVRCRRRFGRITGQPSQGHCVWNLGRQSGIRSTILGRSGCRR